MKLSSMIKGKEGNLLSRLKFKVTVVGEGGVLPGQSWVHF
jgi:hypothetical protein